MVIPATASSSSSRCACAPSTPSGQDLVVVGAGLAGLAAAASAAAAGARTVLLEKSENMGGRALTVEQSGYRFNLGPHALYRDAAGARVLASLGVEVRGRRPPASGGLALRRGRLHALPGGLLSLLTTDLLGLGGKLELARALSTLPAVDTRALRGRDVRSWLDGSFRSPDVRQFLEALLRLTAYANAPERSCAAAAVAQLQRGLKSGVVYVDGGWGSLVEGLVRSFVGSGGELRGGQRVLGVEVVDGGFEVRVAGAPPLRPRSVVLAVPPAAAASMLPGVASGEAAASWKALTPVRAACLDLGLRRLPDPRRLFALGIDEPLYFSVHSASADLAPAGGGALVHVARYLRPGESGDGEVQAGLEALVDRLQPGWRSEVVERRFLPSMTVVGALVEAGRPRPEVDAAGIDGLYLAGDWIGSGEMLADAALESGERAARLVIAGLRKGGAALPAAA